MQIRLTISLTDPLADALRAIATEKDRPIAYIVARMIEPKLKKRAGEPMGDSRGPAQPPTWWDDLWTKYRSMDLTALDSAAKAAIRSRTAGKTQAWSALRPRLRGLGQRQTEELVATISLALELDLARWHVMCRDGQGRAPGEPPPIPSLATWLRQGRDEALEPAEGTLEKRRMEIFGA